MNTTLSTDLLEQVVLNVVLSTEALANPAELTLVLVALRRMTPELAATEPLL